LEKERLKAEREKKKEEARIQKLKERGLDIEGA
jgi:hypothetical protein